MKDTFNANYFITTATIIPVLYLALTLQGSTFDSTIAYWVQHVSKEDVLNISKRTLLFVGSTLLVTAGLSLLITSFVGEFLAIRALYLQQSSPEVAQYVLASTAVLLAVVIVSTYLRFFVAYIRILKESRRLTDEPSDEHRVT
jgi:hypothetical protein